MVVKVYPGVFICSLLQVCSANVNLCVKFNGCLCQAGLYIRWLWMANTEQYNKVTLYCAHKSCANIGGQQWVAKKWNSWIDLKKKKKSVVIQLDPLVRMDVTKELPHKLKYSMCISNYTQTTFFYFGRFLKKLGVQISPITKGSIYHIEYMSVQPFTMGMDWP